MEELMEALRVVRKECDKHLDCDNCPLQLGSSCVFELNTPDEFRIEQNGDKVVKY